VCARNEKILMRSKVQLVDKSDHVGYVTIDAFYRLTYSQYLRQSAMKY